MSAGTRTWAKRLLIAALVIVLVLITGVLAALVYLRTDDGHAWVARRLESSIGSGIRGSLSIGNLDHIGRRGVGATHVVFSDEHGRPVIEADDVELAVDWGALVSGRFVSPRGWVRGGTVYLETMPSGDLRIDRAFESPNPGPPGQPIGEDVVRLENLLAENVRVVMSVAGAPGTRATHLSTICLVRAPEHGSAILEARQIRGQLRIEAPSPIDLDVSHGRLALDGGSRHRAQLDLPSGSGSHRIGVAIAVLADAQERMHVDVSLSPSSGVAALASAPMIAQALAADVLSSSIDVSIQMP
jgi:hypothetical protein